jgi:hypothetical protein
MVRKASITTVFLIILIIITLALSGGGFYLFQKEKLKTQELEAKLDDLNKKQLASETKLQESKKLISELQFKLEGTKKQIDTLNSDLEQQKKDRTESMAKMEQLKLDLEEQKVLRLDLEKKFAQSQEEIRKAVVQIKDLDSKKVTLESKLRELEARTQEVELGKIVVSPESLASEPKDYGSQSVSAEMASQPQILGLQGKVLVVNKEYNFVVMNLGAKDGVDVGDEFSIYHNNKYIGDIKVEKVHESMAAAGFLTSDVKDKINEGDKIVQKVK